VLFLGFLFFRLFFQSSFLGIREFVCVSTFSSMLEDVQLLVCRALFQGSLSRTHAHTYTGGMYKEAPGGNITTTLLCSPETARAALVSTAWSRAFRDCLKAGLAVEAATLWQTAIAGGLDMCDLDKYPATTRHAVPTATRQRHALWLGDRYVLGVMLTRRFADGRHYLHTQYNIPPGNHPRENQSRWNFQVPERLAVVPQVCWDDTAELSEDQLAERTLWRNEQTALLLQWLAGQHETSEHAD
jgi:hypothetical protein